MRRVLLAAAAAVFATSAMAEGPFGEVVVGGLVGKLGNLDASGVVGGFSAGNLWQVQGAEVGFSATILGSTTIGTPTSFGVGSGSAPLLGMFQGLVSIDTGHLETRLGAGVGTALVSFDDPGQSWQATALHVGPIASASVRYDVGENLAVGGGLTVGNMCHTYIVPWATNPVTGCFTPAISSLAITGSF